MTTARRSWGGFGGTRLPDGELLEPEGADPILRPRPGAGREHSDRAGERPHPGHGSRDRRALGARSAQAGRLGTAWLGANCPAQRPYGSWRLQHLLPGQARDCGQGTWMSTTVARQQSRMASALRPLGTEAGRVPIARATIAICGYRVCRGGCPNRALWLVSHLRIHRLLLLHTRAHAGWMRRCAVDSRTPPRRPGLRPTCADLRVRSMSSQMAISVSRRLSCGPRSLLVFDGRGVSSDRQPAILGRVEGRCGSLRREMPRLWCPDCGLTTYCVREEECPRCGRLLRAPRSRSDAGAAMAA